MEPQVRADIRGYIVTTWLSGDARGFDDDTDLHTSGVLDSFSTLALITFLEERFRTRLEPADMGTESLRTVNALTTLVMGKMQRPG